MEVLRQAFVLDVVPSDADPEHEPAMRQGIDHADFGDQAHRLALGREFRGRSGVPLVRGQYEAAVERPHRRLRAVADLELGEHALHVRLHGALGDG